MNTAAESFIYPRRVRWTAQLMTPPPRAVKNQERVLLETEIRKTRMEGVDMVDLLHYLMECKVYIPSPQSRNRTMGWRNRRHVTMSVFASNFRNSNRLPIATVNQLWCTCVAMQLGSSWLRVTFDSDG